MDRQSISRVFAENEGPLKRFIGRMVYRPQDVDDIAQETFIRAFRAERKTRITEPKAYLYRVARNLALRELTRKSTRMTELIEDSCPEMLLVSETDVERVVETRERVARLREAIADLPPQCRKVFVMRKVYGFTHKEIAAQLGISTSTVEKHIASGIKRCRTSVARAEVPSISHISDGRGQRDAS